MKRKRFSEEQIISILQEHAAGMKVKDLTRKHGIAEQTYYLYGRLSRCKPILT